MIESAGHERSQPGVESSDSELSEVRAELESTRADLARLSRIINAAPIGIIAYDPDQQVRFTNRYALDSTGFATSGDFAKNWRSRVHHDDMTQLGSAAASVGRGEAGAFEIRLKRYDDVTVDISGNVFPMYIDDELDGAVTLFREVTGERLQAQQVRWFRAVAEMTTDIVGITLTDGTVMYLNPAGYTFLGLEPDTPLHLDEFFKSIPVQYHGLLVYEAFAAIERGEVWHGDLELIRGVDQALVPMSAVAVGICDDDGELVALAVTYRDVSDRTRVERELAHVAAHDTLTGLASRRELFRALDDDLDARRSTAVIFLDLDDFKVVNDTLGHEIGDSVLTTLAQRISSAARESDLVGRLGGDEFLVICRDVSDGHEAGAIADRILAAVGSPMQIAGRTHLISASSGIALSGVTQQSAATLIQHADMAMYQAKQAGRRRSVVFSDAMRTEATERGNLERDLRVALDQHEFELYFQPLLYLGRSRVNKFEALLRWNHPTLGLLSPGDFLPLADRLGLSEAIGSFVFTAASRAVAAMRLIEPDTTVGVNVHPQQIRHPEFVNDLIRTMLECRIVGEAITIEITEVAMMSDVAHSRQVLEQLQALGVSIAIDDFGTGYSNLDLLRRIPVDYLKIDQSFVAGLGVEPGDTQLVRMILALSAELGIHVIAEGVETELQLAELQRLGCQIGQGYLFSRPLSFDDAIDLLRAQHPATREVLVSP